MEFLDQRYPPQEPTRILSLLLLSMLLLLQQQKEEQVGTKKLGIKFLDQRHPPQEPTRILLRLLLVVMLLAKRLVAGSEHPPRRRPIILIHKQMGHCITPQNQNLILVEAPSQGHNLNLSLRI